MIKSTIHTENKNLKRVKEILNNHLCNLGYTIVQAEGGYKGKKEKALKIEIVSSHPISEVLKSIAGQIRDFNKQEVVLVTSENVQAEFV